MPIELLMPALSPTMTEGSLAKWHKREGDAVNVGDLIAEIETDKATMEFEAADDGVLGKILVDEGARDIAVNTPIALLLEEGEDPSALDAALERAAPAEPPAQAAEPEPAPPAAAEEEAKPPPPAAAKETGKRVFASPLARRMARQAGLELSRLKGSGPHGRIVKKDIESALASGAAPAPPPAKRPAAPAVEASGVPAFAEIPHTSMRRAIARRLSESKREAPHFYLTIDCRVDELLKVREQLNGRSPEEGPGAYKVSLNDFVIRAAALALKKVPAANAAWTETAVRRYRAVDVSVAVAVPDGLITPIIRGADHKGLADISREVAELAARARAGKLAPAEYQGGTFSVSNLGMFGIKEFAAVINPPQGCILAVGAGEQRPVVTDGALAIATVMSCTLSVDHRAVDGAVGAEFMAAFKQLVEDPLTMLL